MFVNPKDMSDDELAYCYDTNPDPAHIAAGTLEYQKWVREIRKEYERRFPDAAFWLREVKFAEEETE